MLNTGKRVTVKGALKKLGIILGGILGLIMILFFILLSWSPGKVEPYLDEKGNILAESVAEILRNLLIKVKP